ncbi:MAG TPA: tetratricopeptide repeat protein [Methylophilaceae bacterium]|jgi:predicted TPR repeat methyltransferase
MKLGRNDACSCGSGKKYKHCCQGIATTGEHSINAVRQDSLSSQINHFGALFNAGLFAEMERHANAVISNHPNSGISWKALGIALQAQGKDSLNALQKAAKLLPDDAETQRNMAILLQSSGRLAEAEVFHRRAAVLKPDMAEAHISLGLALFDQAKLSAAETCFKKALTLQPDSFETHNNLGKTLYAQGKLAEAEICYRRAIDRNPEFMNAYFDLGNILKDQNKLADAAECFKSCLALDPEDTQGSRLLLASIGIEPLPLRASDAQLDSLYSIRAQTWDKNTKTSYHGAELVARALKEFSSQSITPSILDAGCGTGSVGLLIHTMTEKLDGIDLSAPMLEKAREKGIYANLIETDLVSYMVDNPRRYDAITCAATLIHFGDLTPAFEAAASCLKDHGLFIFTLFPNDHAQDSQEVIVAPSSELARGGCFAHSRDYVRRLAKENGFMVESLTDEIHEFSDELPVPGLLVTLRMQRNPV